MKPGRFRALVLAAGEGVEMRPLSEGYPKTLLRILGKPVVRYVLENLRNIGVRDAVVVVNKQELFEKELSGIDDLNIAFVEQTGRGITQAVKSATKFFEDEPQLLMAYGDIVAPPDAYRLVLDAYINTGAEGAALMVPERHPRTYGVPSLDERGYIRRVIEPGEERPEVEYVMGGFYVLPGRFIKLVKKGLGLVEAFNKVAQHGLSGALWTGWWVNVDYPWDLLKAVRNMLSELKSMWISEDAEISPKALVEGPVYIDSGAKIEHEAIVRGPVYIGRNSYIGTNTLVRNYTSVEEGCVVGAYSELVHTVLQPRSVVSRGSLIGYSVVGRESVIGPGTISTMLYGEELTKRYADLIGRIPEKIGAVIGHKVRLGPYNVLKPGAKVRSGVKTGPFEVLE